MDERVFFHLTGARSGALEPIAERALRPALFARVRDLARLRHDFPLVLVEPEGGAPFARTLSEVFDALLTEIAPRGIAGERLRRHVLRLERELRARVGRGASATLLSMWEMAAERVVEKGGEPARADLARARAALRVDGDLVGCDAAFPGRFLTHAWRILQRQKARRVRRDIDALAVRLADLLRGDLLRSEAGRRPAMLRAAVGTTHRDLFDFGVMARVLAGPSGPSALPDARRRRIEGALDVLRAQRFFGDESAYSFVFESVAAATAAYGERLAEMAALVRAIAVAELEVRGAYVEARHDGYFAGLEARSLAPEDRALFPDYLVCLAARVTGPAARADVVAALTGGVPLKLVLATDDAIGIDAQLATTAMGLGDVFVLQSPASHLPRLQAATRAALAYRGPALVSVFTGALEDARLPAYLVAAAAHESRAFPSFSYDPSVGADWSHRFALAGDPQPERAWPVHDLQYADASGRRVVERVAFTFADFALCDPRQASHFASVPRERWDDVLVPADAFLTAGHDGAGREDPPPAARVPFVYAIDGEDRLYRLVVDDALVRMSERCAEAWERLRELDRLKRPAFTNGQAATPPGEPQAIAAAPASAPTVAPATPERAPAAAATPTSEAAKPSSDEPYIETVRCATCNECTNINPRLFKYDENKQAYIADPAAGTYREIVEAAESCQVAIIHPGKPRDPNEPGLAELVERAAAFR